MIVLGEDMKARIAAKGVSPDRIDIVRDGVEDRLLVRARSFRPEVIKAIRGDFNLFYCTQAISASTAHGRLC